MKKNSLKIDDGYTAAKSTLDEAIELLTRIRKIENSLQPYSSVVLKHPEVTQAKYIHTTVNSLLSLCRFEFSLIYPNLQTHYINSDGVAKATARLSSAIVELEDLLTKLNDISYLITSEEQRVEFLTITKQIIINILLYITTQFRITSNDIETQYLPTYLYCEQKEISYSDLVTQFNQLCAAYNAEYFIYEDDSLESDNFLSMFPSIYQQAEELHYPLTISIAHDLMLHQEKVQIVSDDIEDYARNIEVTTKNINHRDVLNKLEFK